MRFSTGIQIKRRDETEPTFYEKEYLNIIKTLEEELAQNKTIDPEDDYELGIMDGRNSLAAELLMNIKKIMIANFYKHE